MSGRTFNRRLKETLGDSEQACLEEHSIQGSKRLLETVGKHVWKNIQYKAQVASMSVRTFNRRLKETLGDR